MTDKPEHLLKIFTLDLREIWILLLASHGFTSKTPFVLCTIFAVNAGLVMGRGLLIVMVESATAPCFRVAVTVLGKAVLVCLLVTLKVARNGNLL